jgi:methylated-DNA-[protein]-cysteine S-methyltransferase
MRETVYSPYLQKYISVWKEGEILKKLKIHASGKERKGEVTKKILEYLDGKRVDFPEVDLSSLTDFQRMVLEEVKRIPYGERRTYGEIAIMMKKSPRAIGKVLRKNPVPIIIPCHRVVAKNGIGGYIYGKKMKIKLLKLEFRHRQRLQKHPCVGYNYI